MRNVCSPEEFLTSLSASTALHFSLIISIFLSIGLDVFNEEEFTFAYLFCSWFQYFCVLVFQVQTISVLNLLYSRCWIKNGFSKTSENDYLKDRNIFKKTQIWNSNNNFMDKRGIRQTRRELKKIKPRERWKSIWQ